MELILISIIASIITYFVPKGMAKMVALLGAILTLAYNSFMLQSFVADGTKKFVFDTPWFSDAVHFSVGIDGISMLMLLLTNILMVVILLGAMRKEWKRESLFYSLILFMQAALIGVFVSNDGIMFYVFWELALIPIYFLCALWSETGDYKTTTRFFIYTFMGSLAMLGSFIYLGSKGLVDGHTFAYDNLVAVKLSTTESMWVGLGIFIAFAVKIPLLPFNAWQPSTYAESPTPASQLLSGIMLKMGLYGLIRWFFPMVPETYEFWSNLIIILGVIAVIHGALIAIRQNGMKRLTAFASLSHVGLIAAGIATISIVGLQGALVQMFAHGINVVGIFLCIDIIQRRTHTRDLTQLGGIAKQAPYFAALFLILVLGTMAVPFTNGFPGEILLLKSIFGYHTLLGVIAGLTVILCAVYMLRMYQKGMLGRPSGENFDFPDLQKSEWPALIILSAMVIGMGIYPQWIVELTEASSENILNMIKETVEGVS